MSRAPCRRSKVRADSEAGRQWAAAPWERGLIGCLIGGRPLVSAWGIDDFVLPLIAGVGRVDPCRAESCHPLSL